MGTRVYIGRLSYDCRERDLEKFFKGFGKIREILIKNGFGFVEFDDYRDADDAVYELNGKDLLGERMHVEIARGPRSRDDSWNSWGRNRSRRAPLRRWGGRQEKYGPPTRTEYRLIVENLSSKVSWRDLKDYMRQAGEVTYADAHKQRQNEGVVEFASYSDLKNAYSKLNNTDLSGRRIKLVEERPRSRRSRSRSSSRSQSKSRSRTRSRSRRSRSKSVSKSRSRSPSQSRSRSKSRSKLRSKSRSTSRSKLRSKSRSTSRSKLRSRSRSTSRSKLRSRSRSTSRSKLRSKSRSKSISKSPRERQEKSKSRSKSGDRSLSHSPSKSPRSGIKSDND